MTLQIPLVSVSPIERFSELGLLNNEGIPRLNLAKYHFSHGLDLELLTDLYRYWRDFREYGVIEKSWFNESYSIEHEYRAVKCSKRGNDVYRSRVEKRLGWMDRIPNVEFFSEKDLDDGSAYTRMLFFTLSYDINRCFRDEGWANIGLEYNRWICRVRSKYGKVSVLRVWQCTCKGYPHVHGILLFEDKERGSFKVIRHKDMDGSISCRVSDYGILQGSWHSFVDVSAVRTVRGALNYARRYLTRSVEGSASSEAPSSGSSEAPRDMAHGGKMNDLDMSLMWLFSKRSYALSGDSYECPSCKAVFSLRYKEPISETYIERETCPQCGLHSKFVVKGFRSALFDLISNLRNSNKKTLWQLNLLNEKMAEREVWYRWLGVFGADRLGITHNEWEKVLDHDPSAV